MSPLAVALSGRLLMQVLTPGCKSPRSRFGSRARGGVVITDATRRDVLQQKLHPITTCLAEMSTHRSRDSPLREEYQFRFESSHAGRGRIWQSYVQPGNPGVYEAGRSLLLSRDRPLPPSAQTPRRSHDSNDHPHETRVTGFPRAVPLRRRCYQGPSRAAEERAGRLR